MHLHPVRAQLPRDEFSPFFSRIREKGPLLHTFSINLSKTLKKNQLPRRVDTRCLGTYKKKRTRGFPSYAVSGASKKISFWISFPCLLRQLLRNPRPQPLLLWSAFLPVCRRLLPAGFLALFSQLPHRLFGQSYEMRW